MCAVHTRQFMWCKQEMLPLVLDDDDDDDNEKEGNVFCGLSSSYRRRAQ
jgi:hypothetical protein